MALIEVWRALSNLIDELREGLSDAEVVERVGAETWATVRELRPCSR